MSRPALSQSTMCGYQGWFRCPGDGAENDWFHWFEGPPAAHRLVTEMWPDMTEYEADERYPVPGFSLSDGSPATLFSSANPKTVDRHFRWMRQFGIEGVFLQRFLVDLPRPSVRERVLENVRQAVRNNRRAYCIEYDMSGAPPDRLLSILRDDWRWLTREKKITDDPGYLVEEDRPVLAVWGFFPERFDAALAHQIIDFAEAERVHLVGGCNWPWRDVKDPEWARALRRFGTLSPWNVGHSDRIPGGHKANTAPWAEDLAEAQRHGMRYLPVVFPGFQWDNLQRLAPGTSGMGRRKGQFLQEQFRAASVLGIRRVKVAMFDEVNEGTAIFKFTNQPPREGTFATFEGLPSDRYLKIVGEEAKRLRR